MSEIQMEVEKPKEEKEPEDFVKTFKDYFTKIITFNFSFKKFYFQGKMPGMKFFANLQLEIILYRFRKFIDKYDLMTEMDSNDSSMDSPLVDNIENKLICPKEKDFIDNLYKFESIIEVLINIGPYEMLREVKSMILSEFETTVCAIQKYLADKEKDLQYFTTIMHKILFIVSLIVFKLDYYTISVNCLVEKLNLFFIDFVTRAKDTKRTNFAKCLNLVQKFIRIKKNYMTEFCMVATISTKKESMFNFAFHKFCSFGRYFFNNLYIMIDADLTLNTRLTRQRATFKTKVLKDTQPKSISLFSKETSITPKHSRSQTCVTKFLVKDELCKLEIKTKKIIKSKTVVRRRSKYGRLNPEMDKLFKIYFVSKLAKWKYISINYTGTKKEEICRICEKTFRIESFILHLFYCKEQKLFIQNYNELRGELNRCLEKLNKYKE
jgi:hypothetical protein